MTKKFKNKYRIPSTRLPFWDYGWNAAYFITICTKHRQHFFGKVIRKKMQLSEIGELVEKYWLYIPKHFQFVKLDAFIVMPDHFHGIIIIDKPDDKPKNGNNPKWKPGTLGVIINQYKRICTKSARLINPRFAWQSRYYDHVIRNEKSFYRIVKYIKANPKKWQQGR